jgi:hypothetical protein
MTTFNILVTTISYSSHGLAMTTVVIPFDKRQDAVTAANIITENQNWDTKQTSFSQVAVMLFE